MHLHLCMCMYVLVCVHLYVYGYMYVLVCMYVYVCMGMWVWLSVCIRMYLCVGVRVPSWIPCKQLRKNDACAVTILTQGALQHGGNIGWYLLPGRLTRSGYCVHSWSAKLALHGY